MSNTDPIAQAQLASWRRAGHGVWHITLIGEGYDEPETVLYPGRLSKTFATRAAIKEIAIRFGCSMKYVHLQSILLEEG